MTARLPHPVRTVLIAAVVVAGTSEARAEAAQGVRWHTFEKLAVDRWVGRAKGLFGQADVGDALARCLDDAWFLGLPALVNDPEQSACAQLLRPDRKKRSTKKTREAWRTRMSRAEPPPTDEDWHACAAAVVEHQDVDLLAACVRAMKPRPDGIRSLPDKERFDRWLDACKDALGLEVPAAAAVAVDADAGTPPEPATPDLPPLSPSQLPRARHCHRLLPTFYEVNGLQKSSTYFTPDQLRILTKRVRELTPG